MTDSEKLVYAAAFVAGLSSGRAVFLASKAVQALREASPGPEQNRNATQRMLYAFKHNDEAF